MTITWPVTLPQNALVPCTVQPLSSNIESPPAAGPAMSRPRFSGVGSWGMMSSVRMRVTAAQMATLKSFYQTSTIGGSQPFEWKHPETGATVNMKFRSEPQYAVELVGTRWMAEFSAEILPG